MKKTTKTKRDPRLNRNGCARGCKACQRGALGIYGHKWPEHYPAQKGGA